MNTKLQYLTFIQDIIKRLTFNSMLYKCLAFLLLVIAAFGSNLNLMMLLCMFVQVILFWGLDAYYLSLERKYRLLYETKRNLKAAEVDFDLSFTGLNFSDRKYSIVDCFFQNFLFVYYLSLCIFIMFKGVLVYFN